MARVRKKEADDEGYLSYISEMGEPVLIADINASIVVPLPAGSTVKEGTEYVREILRKAAAAAPELAFEYAVYDGDGDAYR